MELTALFKQYLLRKNASLMTVKNYLADVHKFIRWYETTYQKSFIPSNINSEIIEAFKNENKKAFSIRSIERQLSSLKKFFEYTMLEGITSVNPVSTLYALRSIPPADLWHIKAFKDYLYVYNSSYLTIKNYIIDVKQYLLWVTKRFPNSNPLKMTTPDLIREYRDHIISENIFSVSSLNRKLSSLRKYFAWAQEQGFISASLQITPTNNAPNKIHLIDFSLPEVESEQEQKIESNNYSSYSKFPPLRLVQRISNALIMPFDLFVITPLLKLTKNIEKTIWRVKGRPIFLSEKSPIKSTPLSGLPRIINYLKYKRPEWYKKYHSIAITHYFHWAVLMIFMTFIGFALYNSFVQQPKKEPILAAATAPPKFLSFQGRLTDTSDNPITVAQTLRFAIYNDPNASGSASLWQENDTVTPDVDGIFSTTIGSGSAIPQSVFSNNTNLYLGITVGNTPELIPRQPIATVAFAANASALQGLPPTTDSSVTSNTNAILALDSSGNVNIPGSATTTFQSSAGQLTVSGKILNLATAAGSGSNIQLVPDGSGLVDVQKPLTNTTTSNNNLSFAPGAVEVDTLFGVLTNTSSLPSITIQQKGAGALFSAYSGSNKVFNLGNSGIITDTGYTTAGGVFFADGTGLFTQTAASSTTQCLTGGSTPTWQTCLSGSSAVNYWATSNGALYPVNSTYDLLVGGTATTSAKFGFLNVNSGTPVASISANSGNNATYLTGGGTLTTTNAQNITIGGSTAGNISISPLNGSGTLTDTGNLTVSGSTITFSTFSSNGGLIYTNGSGVLTQSGVGSNGQCLTSSGGGAPTFQNCALGATTNFWNQSSGALFPINSTVDVLVGNSATTSAKFGFLNVNSGTPVASISANSGNNATYLTGDGTLATTNKGNLTIGNSSTYNTTGNILLNPNGTGNVGIGTTAPTTALNVVGNSGLALLRLDATNSTPDDIIFSRTDVSNSKIQFWDDNSGNLQICDNNDNHCLGFIQGGNVKIGSPGTNNISALATLDVQAVSGTLPVASISGKTSFASLVVDNSGVGDLLTASSSGNPRFVITQNGNVGIGTTAPTAALDIFGTVDPNQILIDSVGTVASNVNGRRANGSVGALTAVNTNDNLLVLGGYGYNGSAYTSGSFNVGITMQAAQTWTTTANGTQITFNTTLNGTTSYAGRMRIDNGGFVGIGNTAMGNDTLVVNQPNSSGDIFSASQSGSTKFVISNSGNVGVGTTTPGATLDVSGNATISGNLTFYGGGRTIQNTLNNNLTIGGSTTGSIIIDTSQNAGNYAVIRSSGGIAGQGGLRFDQNSSNYYTMWTQGTGTSGFNSQLDLGYDSSTTSMIQIRGNGTVDIGSSNATDQTGLDVTPNVAAAAVLINQAGTGDLFTASASSSTKFVITNSGNVGIGTTIPTAFLDVNEGTNAVKFRRTTGQMLQLTTDANGNILYSQSDNGNAKYFVLASDTNSSGIQFLTNSTGTNNVRATIDNNGNVGVGTTSPLATLDVRANSYTTPVASISGKTGLATLILDQSAGINGGDIFTASSSGLNRFVIQQGGNVGIGITNPTSPLYVSGAPNKSLVTIKDNVTGGSLTLGSFNSGETYVTWGSSGQITGASSNFNINSTSRPLTFQQGGTEYMRLDTFGFVGIGNTTMGNGTLVVNQANTSGDIFSASQSGTTKFIINNNGNVGIGITNDNAYDGLTLGSSLNMSLPNAGKIGFTGSAVTATTYGVYGSTTETILNAPASNGDIAFKVLNAEKARFDSNGNLGIGTTSPLAALDVRSNTGTVPTASISGATSFAGLVVDNSGKGDLFTASSSGLNRFVINQNGNVGVGTTTPGRTLDVTGNWGGNVVVDAQTLSTTTTVTESTKALAYHLTNDFGSSAFKTVTFNITGLPNTDGTFAFIYTNLTNSGGGDTIAVQVNGSRVLGNSGSSPSTVSDTIIRTNGSWKLMGAQGTADTSDLAEWIEADGIRPKAGEIISTSDQVHVTRSQTAYDKKVAGIVSTNPNTVYGKQTDDSVAMALAGRVPAIVTSLNGNIGSGDVIASSPFTGVGMLPGQAAFTVGKALESFTPTSHTCTIVSSYDAITWPADDGTNPGKPCFAVPVSSFDQTTQQVLTTEYGLTLTDNVYIGKIMVLVNLSWTDPSPVITDTGDIKINTTNTTNTTNDKYPMLSDQQFNITDKAGNTIKTIGAFAQAVVANLRTGYVDAQKITTKDLAIGGQSLRDYIIGVIREVRVVGGNNGVISPLAQVETIKTNLISPLASGSAVTVNGELVIRPHPDPLLKGEGNFDALKGVGDKVLLDVQGSASISGSLNSQNLAVNNDATVSGTLYAHQIQADSIIGLDKLVGTFSAQKLADGSINNNASVSSNIATTDNLQTTNLSSTPSGQLLTNNNNFVDIASYSAYLSDVPGLASQSAVVNNLSVFGQTTLGDTTIAGQLAIGGNFILAGNSINILGQDLEIQPLGQGGVRFEGGKFAIDTQGNITTQGNATIYGTLAANVISPLPGQDLRIHLGGVQASTSLQPATSQVRIENASNSAVLSINSLGDIIASGAATINKLNFIGVQPALAVSGTEIIATGSAGTTTIDTHQKEITIDNQLVTENSLIYITPVGTPSAQMPFLLRQLPNQSFTVGTSEPIDNPLQFNWLIVN